jgi:chaperone required for assembly of F1-ATPase
VKRFWTEVAVEPCEGGFGIMLDRRAVRTPARAPLVVESERLAEAMAEEWRACGDIVDPRAMPLTGLANAAIDRVVASPEAFAVDLARYGETDLLCYRAEGPTALVERQSASWGALLDWARQRYNVDFACAHGIVHIAQPEATVARFAHEVAMLTPFQLSGLSPLVTIGGSLVAAFAVMERAMPPIAVWEAVSLDDRWQVEQWGADAEAQDMLDGRRRDFLAAARFLELL